MGGALVRVSPQSLHLDQGLRVSWMKPYLKEMLGQTLFCGANPQTPSVSCFSLLIIVVLSVVPKARMAMEYSSP